ncbi:hypothetical protein BDA99DRAFT_558046 [Phascolomyces articulosus]|uniref:Uncharacterized protein n=1 Tax=Phascolomyces articulosus TaxID=60185 RepID=A0AAD5PGM5_9FUNG|nr:hypothetical protein BDA99DRAFT_558046 [Phascolomyces articulosus]
MAFYPPTNLYPSPTPPMLPPPMAAQPYAPTPPMMGMNPFAPSSADPLMMQPGFPPPPPPLLPPPGGTPLDMMGPPPILPPPRFMPGFLSPQLNCWTDCVGCLAIALCWCFLCDDHVDEADQQYL